ncbi:hypothetical protein PHMEG_0009563 [Phytophthora megakarya]|uniref:Uncharacterized protein n=1 Tax=Phytophthora megakarya TaxID=4795 RepID=A0A225WHA0_9STRA|nr:hypothetical protein PHMEG_0009563 [Phytophthora megakarya]
MEDTVFWLTRGWFLPFTVAKLVSSAVTSARKSTEWGMGSIEKVYHRLRMPLSHDKDKCSICLKNLFRLANYRVRTVGISQIGPTFIHDREDNG